MRFLDAALARIDADLVAFLGPGDAWPVDALARFAKAAEGGASSLLLPCERLRRREGHVPRAEPVPAATDGEPPLSALACRTDALRGRAGGAPTLVGELLARLSTRPGPPLAGAPVVLGAAAVAAPPLAATPTAWADLLRAAGAGLAASRVVLVGLDAAGSPAGHLDLLGHAAALSAPGRPVDAFTLADLDRSALREAAKSGSLVVTARGDFGVAEAATQLCFEELLWRSEKRPVRLALRRLAPSSLDLGGRLVEAARAHPDLEVWVSDAVSRSYAALLLGAHRVRLVPPGIAGLAPVLGSLRAFRAELTAGLSQGLGATPPTPDGRLADLAAWHAGFDRDAGRRLGPVAARITGATHLLRTPALEEAWSLLLPGSAALGNGEDGPLGTASLDVALFAALSGRRPVELAGEVPGLAAFATTWGALLDAVGIRLTEPAVRLAG